MSVTIEAKRAIVLPSSPQGLSVESLMSTVTIRITCDSDDEARVLQDNIVSSWLDQHRIILQRDVELQYGDLTLRYCLLKCGDRHVKVPPIEHELMVRLMRSEPSTRVVIQNDPVPNSSRGALHRLKQRLLYLGSKVTIESSKDSGYWLQFHN